MDLEKERLVNWNILIFVCVQFTQINIKIYWLLTIIETLFCSRNTLITREVARFEFGDLGRFGNSCSWSDEDLESRELGITGSPDLDFSWYFCTSIFSIYSRLFVRVTTLCKHNQYVNNSFVYSLLHRLLTDPS